VLVSRAAAGVPRDPNGFADGHWAIAREASSGYLGLGDAIDTAARGRAIADGQRVFVVARWVSTAPGVMMVIMRLTFNLLGDGLRDAIDPKRQTREERGFHDDG